MERLRVPLAVNDVPIATGCDPDQREQLRAVARLLLSRLDELGLGGDEDLPLLRAFATTAAPAAPAGRFARLAQRLGLSPLDSMLVAATLSPDADPRFRAAWELAGGHPRPTLGTLRDVAGDRDAVMALLAESHVLRELRLVSCVDTGSSSPYDHALVPGLALAGWLSSRVWDEAGAGVEVTPAEAMLGDVVPDELDAGRFVAGLRTRWTLPRRRVRSSAPPTLMCIEGLPGSGRDTLAEAIAGALGLPLARLVVDDRWADRVPGLLRAALLGPACPCLVVEDGGGARHVGAALRSFARLYEGPMLVVCPSRPAVPAPWGVLDLPTRLPTAAVREKLWRRALDGREAGLELGRAARLPLGHGAVFRVAACAVAAADTAGGALDEKRLAEAARCELQSSSPLFERLHGDRRLADLVAAGEVRAQLEEILAFARHRFRAYEEWGLRNLGPAQPGLKALFYGPPGTGKTMAAQIIATELDVDLYRVDLSSVVSKWVGETEKHLKQLFDLAESTDGMLLFDEADALFAKRATRMESSNDRHSNMEVNYLLQRMESFNGVCILTTNHDRILDEAFRRRLNFRVEFLVPDEHERELLWRKLTEAVPHEADLDHAAVARRFEMAGGNIRNAVIRAVVLAIDEGQRLATRHLLEAATREYAESGRVTRARKE